MILELANYGPLWLAFAAIALFAARLGGFWGILGGHLLIAAFVTFWDLHWLQEEVAQANWEGNPDQDGVFALGLALRIVLINVILLPLSFVARHALLRSLKNLPAPKTAPTPAA